MGAQIPEKFRRSDLDDWIVGKGFDRRGRGKVRDIYMVGKDKLLLVAPDRISIFDFVLPALVPKKGEVLSAITHFWITAVLNEYPSHFLYADKTCCHNAIAGWNFRDNSLREDLIKRGMLVRKVAIPPIEYIFRMHLGGSVFAQYRQTGIAAGVRLGTGKLKWEKLRQPLFTPSTKAESGHDRNISQQEYRQIYGDWSLTGADPQLPVNFFREVYVRAYNFAKARGIRILDTKLEGDGVLADEVITPDSSRFTITEDWQKAMEEGRDPIFYDKEFVRIWGRQVQTPFRVTGINELNPDCPEHVAFVHSLVVPEDVIRATTERYLEIFRLLTGKTLEDYQRAAMGTQ